MCAHTHTVDLLVPLNFPIPANFFDLALINNKRSLFCEALFYDLATLQNEKTHSNVSIA